MDASIKNIKPDNIEKLKTPVKISYELYPDMDVFLSGDKNGELIMKVQNSEPLLELIDEDVRDALNVSNQELFALVSMVIDMKNTHNSIWGIKKPFVVDSTKNIDKMSPVEIAFQLNSLIKSFKKVHQKELN